MLWVAGTVLLFTLVAVWYIYRTGNEFSTVDGFLTARHQLSTGTATATILASIMGAWILFTPAEAGTWGGIAAFGGYALAQAGVVMLFALLGPRLRRLAPHGSTLFEFVYYRFGRGMYTLVLVIGVFYMAVFLAAELTGIALAVNLVTGAPLWATALLVGGGTLVYTTYGGIRGSIFTDSLQALIMIPTLVLAFGATAYFLGGPAEIVGRIREIDPNLLSAGNLGGLEFAAVMLIAVVAANMFHQGFWSRVYACRDEGTVRRSFLLAGLLVIPMMLLAGMFGLLAVAGDTLMEPSAALFEVVLAVTPPWVIGVVLVLAVVLVMSSADTMINAIAAVFTVDIARFRPRVSPARLQVYARLLTAAICGVVILIASRGYSVLYLFLLADLVCAAAVFPTFWGLYSRRLTGRAAVVATLAGIIAGVPFFPDPSLARGHLLLSFLLALVIPVLLLPLFERLSRVELNLETLREKVHDIPN